MRKQVLLGFLLPGLLLVMGSIRAWQWHGVKSEGTRAPSAQGQVELEAERQRVHRSILERLKNEGVKRVYHPMPIYYSSLDQFIQRADGVVLVTVLGSEPLIIEDSILGPFVCTDFSVLIEDDLGNAAPGYEKGKKVKIRSIGGRIKISGHYLELTNPDWRPLKVGERALIFLRKENDNEPYYEFRPGVLPIKDGKIHLEGPEASELPFAVGKSSNEFMAEIRAAAWLLGTERRRWSGVRSETSK
jgi:hypothetical protein